VAPDTPRRLSSGPSRWRSLRRVMARSQNARQAAWRRITVCFSKKRARPLWLLHDQPIGDGVPDGAYEQEIREVHSTWINAVNSGKLVRLHTLEVAVVGEVACTRGRDALSVTPRAGGEATPLIGYRLTGYHLTGYREQPRTRCDRFLRARHGAPQRVSDLAFSRAGGTDAQDRGTDRPL